MRKLIANIIFLLVVHVLFAGNLQAQNPKFVAPSASELAKLRAAVEARPDSLSVHEAYLAGFATGEAAEPEYRKLIAKFPNRPAIHIALAEKFGAYSPRRAQYLLNATALDPGNSKTWEDLALDASMRGNKVKEEEYLKRAVAAAPDNLGLKARIVYLSSSNPEEYKKKAFEFAGKYPTSEETISILNLAGVYLKDLSDRIAAGELLLKLFPTAEGIVYQVGLSRLVDSYIMNGQYEDAIGLAGKLSKAASRLGFGNKLVIARKLGAAESRSKEGKVAEALDSLLNFNVKSRSGSDIGSHFLLKKAQLLDANGRTQAAYDSLINFQSKTPIPKVREDLNRYGSKLGKNPQQVQKDVYNSAIANSKAALPFVLDTYTSDKKVTLDNLKGKVTLLSFWYPGCGPCRGEMPHIEAALKGLDRNKMQYFGVNIYRAQDDFVAPFMKDSGYSFTALGGSEAITKDYNVRAAPTNMIIDQEGRIVYANFMVESDNEIMLTMMLESLINKQ